MEKTTTSPLSGTCRSPIASSIQQAVDNIVRIKPRVLTDDIIRNITPESGKELTLTDHTCSGAVVRIRHNIKD